MSRLSGARREEVDERALSIRAELSTEPLRLAAAVVNLEGPEHISEIAQLIENHAHNVYVGALRGEIPDTIFDVIEGRPLHGHHNAHLDLVNEISAFTVAARSHLNDSTKPRRS
ncbi:hypothetical protein ABZ479_10805 [Streptomyces sp. NPDC005722]